MAIFKCKMCGGTLEFNPGDTVAVCDSCGTKQTLPRLDDDKKANLYDRANHFRRNNEYDKAMSIYEQILAEDNTDAEAYWSLVLCRYGIEYVEDPATGKRIPTVNRAQFTSVFDDDNYKSALRCADAAQKEIYEAEAKAINEIQKGILAISQKEEPFDVFICYKETDSRGARTPDSVLANDLYHQLTQEDFKVFFSRITLEDKLGSAYEPYIFAALNSAKVMVVLGTRPEYFNAVWVKNEWSRYLALIKNGAKKMLIPAYKDMDPYDLPEEFSHLQAQDMGKLGFMQDLIRGIKKIVSSDGQKTAAKPAAPAAVGSTGAAPLLERAFLFLEDGKWSDADTYCEKVLDIDPKNAQAYLGKLMAELQVSKRGQLSDCAQPFDKNENYLKILRFGDEALKTELREYIDIINERNETRRKSAIYNEACGIMKSAAAQKAFLKGAELFKSISGFRDADALAAQCLEKAESCRKDALYNSAIPRMTVGNIASYEEAIAIFKTIPGWRDADSKIYACQKRIEEIKAKEEAARLEALRKAEEKRITAAKRAKRLKKFAAIATPVLCVCIAFVIVLTTVIIPSIKYNSALNLYNTGMYDEAITAFKNLNGYKDSEKQLENCYIGKLGEEKWNKIKNIKIGDSYIFGTYEQDNNISNGKEAIEWTVLNKDGMSLLLVSKQALDCKRYDTSYIDVTWENCSLRKWMNNSFLNEAFSEEEKALIQSTTVSAYNNPSYNTDPGNDTTDKVFLLSINEAEKYFNSDEARKCALTAYAKAQGAMTIDTYKTPSGAATCWWWLRSPGARQDIAATVYLGGSVDYSGSYVSNVHDCVRPALWISIE